MRKLSLTAVMALVLGLAAIMLNPPAPVAASPADLYSGANFGAGNLPAGCENDVLVGELRLVGIPNPVLDPKALNNMCHHMRTDMNGLDSPQIDVLVMLPLTPAAERDMRIMRQAVEMWEGGIDYLAPQMEMQWMADGVDFHITVDYFDPAGDDGGEFTTEPVIDPEIVVIGATNPVGGLGIGIDPVANVFVNPNGPLPCLPVDNPFDVEAWEALPGFNDHHAERSGTYNEDCGDAEGGQSGGNVCFAVNTALDPAPDTFELVSLFDLVAHEFGHCMTVGHVGDGAEGLWNATPTNDIMAYHSDPPGINKCVSTLDVEGVATVVSRYLDVDGDGVAGNNPLLANDQAGQGGNPFQVQHPDDHLYASGTGSPLDCPQPDLGVVPGPRTDWTPTPVRTTAPVLTITGPEDGAVSQSGVFDVTGTVEHKSLVNEPTEPTEPTGSVDDADDDATTPVTEILDLNVAVTDTHVDATIKLADLWPSTQVASPTSYSVVIDGRKFDSFIRYAIDPNPMTWDNGDTDTPAKYMPAGTSSWDLAAKTVKFHIPRSYLSAEGITSPYYLGSHANVGLFSTEQVDDSAPDGDATVGVAGPNFASLDLGPLPGSLNAQTVTFENPDGNTFYTEQSTLGTKLVTHDFSLNVTQPSDVDFVLNWTDDVGGSDLDLHVTGAATSGTLGATSDNPEVFGLDDLQGTLNLQVEPYFVTDPLSGSTYTLTATITPNEIVQTDTDSDGILDVDDTCPSDPGIAPTGCPDSDGDGVIDLDDVCPNEPGEGADGCPIVPTEVVHLWVGGAIAATDAVDTANGPDTFNLPVALAEGTYEVRVDWEAGGKVIASRTMTLTHDTDDDDDGVTNDLDRCAGFDDFDDTDRDGVPDGCDTDTDGDGVADHRDNCPDVSNANQANMDGDAKGDVCDSDMDGDGHSNGKERAHGTNPADPNSYPGKPKAAVL